jgi:hypothetical protein
MVEIFDCSVVAALVQYELGKDREILAVHGGEEERKGSLSCEAEGTSLRSQTGSWNSIGGNGWDFSAYEGRCR